MQWWSTWHYTEMMSWRYNAMLKCRCPNRLDLQALAGLVKLVCRPTASLLCDHHSGLEQWCSDDKGSANVNEKCCAVSISFYSIDSARMSYFLFPNNDDLTMSIPHYNNKFPYFSFCQSTLVIGIPMTIRQVYPTDLCRKAAFRVSTQKTSHPFLKSTASVGRCIRIWTTEM